MTVAHTFQRPSTVPFRIATGYDKIPLISGAPGSGLGSMSFINQPTQFLPQTSSNRMTEEQCWLGQRSLKDKEETKERKNKHPKPIETKKQEKRKQK